ncbi:Protein of unknown function [Pyronema omphalodes CBS 100304]|uniref:Uncharacterized protein n=1 Tax=Pyronema omphalodes (strain CBS 100304) TaxID=1076935 RepID=U4L4N5_PYROM|nr:Protein of unknown function [Pyronema omphalodes CBS 100304]
MGLEWSQERAEKYLVAKCKKQISEVNREKLKKVGLVGPRTTVRLEREAAALQAAAALDEAATAEGIMTTGDGSIPPVFVSLIAEPRHKHHIAMDRIWQEFGRHLDTLRNR